MEQSKQVINSVAYQDLIKEIQKRTKLKILDEYRDTAASRDTQKMEIVKISAHEAIEILEKDKVQVYNYVVAKMTKFEGVKFDEEYPQGEEPDDEDDPHDKETVLGYYPGFLLMYLMEYYLLKNKPSELEPYLKAIRIPHVKKYQKDLKEIFNSL